MVKQLGIVPGLAVSLMLADASHAGDREEQADSLGGTGVTLYEISERVTFDPDPSSAGVIRRNATSPLQGFAEVGTPLCPSELLISDPGMKSCTVIATGTDSVSTVTGVGPVRGTFDVVINAPGNSSVHVPDLRPALRAFGPPPPPRPNGPPLSDSTVGFPRTAPAG